MTQQYAVTLADNGDGQTSTLTVGGFGLSVPNASLFGAGANPDQLKANVKLAFLVGGYAQLESSEFLTGLRRQGSGLRCQDADYAIQSVQLTDPANAAYTVTFTTTALPGQTFGVTARVADLSQPNAGAPQPSDLLPNVIAALRVAGYTSLTLVIGGLNGWQFVSSRLFWF